MKLINYYPSTGCRVFWSEKLQQEISNPHGDYFTSYFPCCVNGDPKTGYTKSQIKKMISQEFPKFSLRMGKPFNSRMDGSLIWQARINEK